MIYWIAAMRFNFDGPVKSRKIPLFVIPAEAGIQLYQMVTACLDSGFHRSDDFLRDRQFYLGILNKILYILLSCRSLFQNSKMLPKVSYCLGDETACIWL